MERAAEQAVERKPTMAAMAGGATRDRGGSGSGGPHRARAVKFRVRTPSYILRRRRFGCGAKILDLDEDIGADGETGVGHGGAVPGAAAGHAANQVDTAAGTNQVDGTRHQCVLELTMMERPQVLGM